MQIDRPVTSTVPTQTVKPVEKKPDVSSMPEAPSIPEPSPIEKYNEKFKIKPTDSEESLVDPEKLESITSQIQNTSSKSMLLETQDVPTPLKLEEALQHVTLNPTVTEDKTFSSVLTETRQETERLQERVVPVKTVEKMYNPETLKELYTPHFQEVSKAFTKALVEAGQKEENNLTELFKSTFQDSLKQLDKSDSGLDAKQKIERVVHDTQAFSKTFFKGLNGHSDIAMLLKMKSQSERKELVLQMIAELKGYGPKEMAKLSEKKLAFIDAIVSGMEKGMLEQASTDPKETLALSLEAVTETVKRQLQDSDPECELVKTLSLSSSNRMMQTFTEQLGVRKPVFFEAIFNGVIDGLPNQASEDLIDVPGKPDVQAPAFLPLGDKQYKLSGFLGFGGFANTLEYVNVLDPNDKIAVKQLKMDKAISDTERLKLRDSAVEESLAHMELQGPDGHPNVIGFKGVVNGPKGQVYIVQECAPKGSLDQVRTKLDVALKYHLIPPSARQMLVTGMVREALQAMQHVQTERQGHHFDLKIYNMMMGGDDQVKLIDFGLSGLGRRKEYDSTQDVADNPIYKAPEQLGFNSETVRNNINNYMRLHYDVFEPFPPKLVREPKAPVKPENLDNPEVKKSYKKSLETYQTELMRREKYVAAVHQYNQDKDHYEANKDKYEQIFNQLEKEGLGHVFSGHRSDTWNMGLVIYEMLYGNPDTHPMYNEPFMSQVEKNLHAFAKDPENRFMDHKEFLTPMDKLINGFMHPQPGNRLTFEAALESSVFFDEQLDMPELKQLQAIMTKLPSPPKEPNELDVEGQRVYKEVTLPEYERQIKAFQTEVDPLLKKLSLA